MRQTEIKPATRRKMAATRNAARHNHHDASVVYSETVEMMDIPEAARVPASEAAPGTGPTATRAPMPMMPMMPMTAAEAPAEVAADGAPEASAERKPEPTIQTTPESTPKTPVATSVALTTTQEAGHSSAGQLVVSRTASRKIVRTADLDAGFRPDSAAALRERCTLAWAPLVLRAQAPVASLGLFGAVPGDGVSLLAWMFAQGMANAADQPVTLIECNWEHADAHTRLGVGPTPGLAEWLRGERDAEAMRHAVSENLTVVCAGDARQAPVRLAHLLQRATLRGELVQPNEIIVFDFPPLSRVAYGLRLASMADSLLMVVRWGITPDERIRQASTILSGYPLAGVMLNRVSQPKSTFLRRFTRGA